MLQIVYFRIAKHLGVVLSVLFHAFGHVLLLLLSQWKAAATARRVRLGDIEKFNHRGCCIFLAQSVVAAAGGSWLWQFVGLRHKPKARQIGLGGLAGIPVFLQSFVDRRVRIPPVPSAILFDSVCLRERKIRWATFSYNT